MMRKMVKTLLVSSLSFSLLIGGTAASASEGTSTSAVSSGQAVQQDDSTTINLSVGQQHKLPPVVFLNNGKKLGFYFYKYTIGRENGVISLNDGTITALKPGTTHINRYAKAREAIFAPYRFDTEIIINVN
ncbi:MULTISPECIES: hypothetical protein [Paenibacillus]|uniref:hypothetical protein n=1 Tax=Paenibacillus TaxID=44249 RepID=UPI0022B8889D|nr:hypothetical protein [Paenibacillus caseinilyticus]MCZ8520837.1 hypothetical protein [Paenibacillus caseinilyticus]